jgi:hypothetical protein
LKNSLIIKLLKQYVEDVQGVLSVLFYNRKDYSILSNFEISTFNETEFNTLYSSIIQYFYDIENEYGKQNFYILLIISGILLIWFISNWNLLYSFLISIALIFLFLLIRMWHHKKKSNIIYIRAQSE